MRVTMKKLLILVNVDWFFLSHRKDIALAARVAGYDVTIVAKDTGHKRDIENLGFHFIDFPITRSKNHPLQDFRSFVFLLRLFYKCKPLLVHNVGLKVVLISGIACKITRVKGLVSALSGLGVTFQGENSRSIFTLLLIKIMRIIHQRSRVFSIFQNKEDRSVFTSNRIVNERGSIIIKGSGINLTDYYMTPEPVSDRIKIILTARMLVDKGILILVEAAKLLKKEYETKAQFILCGGLDENPHALSKTTMMELVDGDYILWLGHRTDIKYLLMNSHVFVLPSSYKEGLPKSLIEAAASGRPIITTDSVGCRDAVIDGFNGFLIPINDSKILAEKLKVLIGNKKMRIEYGANSRTFAERYFSIEEVIDKHIQVYKMLSED